MKTPLHALLSMAILWAICTGNAFAAQLNGTYTINPGGTATTTNFKNIQSAVTFMTSTGARTDGGPANSGTVGVNGPVLFQVSAATFSEQVTIPAITGASATNTITFKGAGPSSTLLTFASADANNRHTLKLNLSTYVTFRDMTIRGTGATYAWTVHVMGLNANFNSFRNCTIEVAGTGTTTTSSNFIAVVLNNSATAPTTGTRQDGIVFDSCLIDYGYYGICAAGAASNLKVGLQISNSTINNSALYPIYATYINGITVDRNVIFPRPSYQYNYGIYLLNSICTAPNRHVFTNNRIYGYGYYGIYITGSSNLVGNKGFIFNNMIGGMTKYEYSRCLFLSSTSYWAISNNTFGHDYVGQSNVYGSVYITGGSGISFRNNICQEKLSSPAVPLYASAASVFDTMNYNLFYRPDTLTGGLIYVGGMLTSGTFRGASGHNANSLFGDPQFPNDTQLTNTNPCYTGTPIGYIPTDIFGNTRSTTNPIMGAYETPALTNNLAVMTVTNITPPITTGGQDLTVRVRNNGTNSVTSFNLSYSHNGGTPVVYGWTGFLGACDTTSITFSGSQQPTFSAVNNFKIYSSLPNGNPDNEPNNDTIIASYYVPLNGVYQVGGSTPDFFKPSDAFNAAISAGITGPVVFVVNPGTYTDQITIDKIIPGLSATNTIQMVGTNKNTCIIQTTNAGPGLRHTVQIGQSHIRFDSLTLRAASPNAGWVVHINKNQSKNIKVKNCIIEVTHPNSFNSSSDVYMGVVMSGSNTTPYYYDTYVLDSIEIDSNIIRGGYAGIWQYSYFYSYYYTYGAPSERLAFRNNQIYDSYYFGINTNGTRSLKINGNLVSMRKVSTSSITNYAIYVQSHDGSSSPNYSFEVNNNRVIWANYMGLYLYNCLVSSLNRGSINNNAVSVGYNYPNCYGMYIYQITNSNFYHNSVLNNQPSTSNTNGALYMGYCTGFRMRNNHLVVSNAYSLGTPAYMAGNSFTSPAEFNYNNFYRPDTTSNFVYINSWYQGTAFRGVTGNNINSLVVDPGFVADSLLKTYNGCINGDTCINIPFDLEGSARGAIPDMGAYEIPMPPNDAGVKVMLAPTPPVQAGANDVYVVIVNNGINDLYSANVGYRLNNGTPVVQPWSGFLPTCDTIGVLFSGTNQLNILPGSINTLKVFTSAPNGMPDANTLNDTLVYTLATPMKGTYIVGPAPSDFLTLTAAGDALRIRGVDSIVTMRVKTGNYNEQLNLTGILGTSETNRVIFTSFANHRDSVVVSRANNTIGDNFIVKLSGTKYVTFQNMTLSALGASYSTVVDIQLNAGFATFRNCKLLAPVVASTSTNMAVVYGINNLPGNITFVGNQITGGAYGIYLRGTSTVNLANNITIDSNAITNFYYMGLYNYYNANERIRYNSITTNSVYTSIYCIYGYYIDSVFEISHNLISSTTANGYGINTYYCDGVPGKTGLIANNVVRVGTGSTTACYGIRDQYSSYMLIANNTVAVSSTSTTSYAGYFYYSATYSNFNRIRNNVLVNLGTGPAVYFYNPVYGTSDFNLIFTNGTATLLQRGTPAGTYTSLQLFRAAVTNYERNSLQYRAAFTSATNMAPNLADTAAWAMKGRGTQLSELGTSFNGPTRPTTIADGVPNIGAYEFTPTSIAPLCTPVPVTPTAGGIQVFLFGTDTVCKVYHSAFTTAPASLAVRQYTGVRPPAVAISSLVTNLYLDMTTPIGSYLFDLDMYYKNEWLGNNPSELDLKMAQKSPSTSWLPFLGSASSVDTTKNILSAQYISNYGMFTGTDDNNPLPVELSKFEGYAVQSDVLLTWQTATEKNSSHFEVERSFDGHRYEKIGTVSAAGNSVSTRSYLYQDVQVLNNRQQVYYRLRVVDRDERYEYSKVVAIHVPKAITTVKAGPNPFRNQLNISGLQLQDQIEIMDLNGKLILTQRVDKEGEFRLAVPEQWERGIYFIKIGNANQSQVFKMIKE